MSYIIKNNQLIAVTSETLKSGMEVRYSSASTNNRKTLVNANTAKISNAKKWQKQIEKQYGFDMATSINANNNEFLID